MYLFDTISAISTAYGTGGVALVRVSGEKALEVGSRVCAGGLEGAESNRAYYKKIISSDGRVIDDAVVTVFRAPRSYTGEDTVELSCHGGIKVTEEVFRATLEAGARPAEAGEFSRRALLSGKISVARAEATGELFYAKTSEQVKLFSGGAADALERRVKKIYDSMAALLADMYARIDFPEEDLGSLSDTEIEARLEDISGELSALLNTYKSARAVSQGIKTAIVGRTNAGKSSLYNLLVGHDAAIVTDIEGTTRDTLEETVPLGRLTLRLCDTAGLRKSDDAVEKIGIERALERIRDAELVIALFDNTRPFSPEDEMLLSAIDGAGKSDAAICVINKRDLPRGFDAGALAGREPIIEISAKSGEGTGDLTAAVEERYISGELDLTRDALITTERQFSALSRAKEAVCRSLESLRAALPQDLCSVDLESAMSAIAEVGGASVSDDVLEKIFKNYCIGK